MKKIIINFSIYFVGLLFIISGLIKLNDPIGTAIKMDEYFHVFADDFGSFFELFIPWATPIAVIFCILEVVLGVALVLKYQLKLTVLSLLGVIVFFTFLTFYSAVFNKVTDCGCFGDAIKLTPWTSFVKDVILTFFITVLVFNFKTVKSLLNDKSGNIVMLITLLISCFIAWYSIEHLSFIDFRAYKVGASIPENMKLPEGAKQDVYSTMYTLKNSVSGLEKKMSDKDYISTKIWEDTTWIIEKTEGPILISKGDKAKISDYRLSDNDKKDMTEESFKGIKLLIPILFTKDASLSNIKKITDLIKKVEGSSILPMVITASPYEEIEQFRNEHQIAAPYYYCDATVIKTMIRSSPGILLLKNGTVLGKWHHNDTPTLEELKKLIQ